jgi:hypothetical protein
MVIDYFVCLNYGPSYMVTVSSSHLFPSTQICFGFPDFRYMHYYLNLQAWLCYIFGTRMVLLFPHIMIMEVEAQRFINSKSTNMLFVGILTKQTLINLKAV